MRRDNVRQIMRLALESLRYREFGQAAIKLTVNDGQIFSLFNLTEKREYLNSESRDQ